MQENDTKIFSINKRILQLIEYLNITRYRFSQTTGISEVVLLNIYKGKNKPSFDVIEKILNQYPEINADWLLMGKGDMLKSTAGERNPGSSNTNPRNKGIPLIHLRDFSEMFASEWSVSDSKAKTFVVPIFSDADFLIGVEGVSMSPKYAPGDILACKKLPSDAYFQWNRVYVLDTDQGTLIRRVKKGPTDDTFLLVAENPDFEPFEIRRSHIFHVGIVSGVIRIE